MSRPVSTFAYFDVYVSLEQLAGFAALAKLLCAQTRPGQIRVEDGEMRWVLRVNKKAREQLILKGLPALGIKCVPFHYGEEEDDDGDAGDSWVGGLAPIDSLEEEKAPAVGS